MDTDTDQQVVVPLGSGAPLPMDWESRGVSRGWSPTPPERLCMIVKGLPGCGNRTGDRRRTRPSRRQTRLRAQEVRGRIAS